MLFFSGGRGEFFTSGNSLAFASETSSSRRFLVRDSEGEITGLVEVPFGRAQINHNAAEDQAFQGLEGAPQQGSPGGFFGLYDFNLRKALTIIFLAAGGLLVLASNIKERPAKRYY